MTRAEALSQPYSGAFSITPSDSTDFSDNRVTRGILLPTSGQLSVEFKDSSTQTFANHPAGLFPYRLTRVNSTGTSISGLVGYY